MTIKPKTTSMPMRALKTRRVGYWSCLALPVKRRTSGWETESS